MDGRRRVGTTWAVGQAWERFSLEKVEVVRKSFRVLGLSLTVNGSEDHQISVKGLASEFLKEGLVDWNEGVEVNSDGDEGGELEEEDNYEINFCYD